MPVPSARRGRGGRAQGGALGGRARRADGAGDGATSLARLDYAAVVDEATFAPVERVEGPARALVAARFGSTRLIDNLLLPAPSG